MGAADVFGSVAGLSLPEVAGRFAAAGAPIFPCVPGGKRPLTGHGFHDATTDLRQVDGWWRRWPDANIGLPTGSASGVDVVDVDRKAGGSGFAAFNRAGRTGLVNGWLMLVRTPSGGMHAYYPADPNRPQPSWQAATARVDFRGDGGYVIVPPSIVEQPDGSSGSYTLIGGPDRPPQPVDATALRKLLDPRPEPTAARYTGPVGSSDAARLAGWVAARGEGERNRGLFWASCRLAEAGMSIPEMTAALAPAAELAGLEPREVTATIRSAYRATHTHPAGPDGGHGGAPRRPVPVASQVLS